jgi:hypothetical protein
LSMILARSRMLQLFLQRLQLAAFTIHPRVNLSIRKILEGIAVLDGRPEMSGLLGGTRGRSGSAQVSAPGTSGSGQLHPVGQIAYINRGSRVVAVGADPEPAVLDRRNDGGTSP